MYLHTEHVQLTSWAAVSRAARLLAPFEPWRLIFVLFTPALGGSLHGAGSIVEPAGLADIGITCGHRYGLCLLKMRHAPYVARTYWEVLPRVANKTGLQRPAGGRDPWRLRHLLAGK